MAARPPPSGAGSAKAKPSTGLTKLTKLADKGSKKLQKRDKDVEKPEKKKSKSASTDSGKGEKKQKNKDRPASSSEKTSNKRAKAGDASEAPQKRRRRNADSLELPDIRPRKNWKVMDDAMRGRCLSMVDQALLLARSSESGNLEHKARVDKNLAMLRERIEALFSDIKVPNRTAAAIAQKKQHQIEENIVATRELLSHVRQDLRFETQALAAEKEREQALIAEVASLQKRVHDLTTQKTHPILRHRTKEATPWPLDVPVQPHPTEALIKPTDDPEFEKLKALTARHLSNVPAHEAAVAPVLEGLSHLKEQLVMLLEPEL